VSITYPCKKKSHGIRSILVGSEAAPGLLQHIWVEMDYWLSICHVTWGRCMELLQVWRGFLSICRSHVTILSTIHVYRFYEVCQGTMNNPVSYKFCRLH